MNSFECTVAESVNNAIGFPIIATFVFADIATFVFPVGKAI
jgi:hypothetical protein